VKRLVLTATFVVVLAASTVGASTFVAMTDAELVNGADAVVRGRVVDLQTRFDDTGRLVITEATVRVREVLVGEAPEYVTVRTVGGEIGGFRVDAPGFPQLERRQHVVLMIEQNDRADGYRVRGYQQGHFEVVRRLDGVRLAVPQVEEGTRLITQDGRLLPEPRAMTMAEFRRSIRDIARGDDVPQR
jgi:hypothetical protein